MKRYFDFTEVFINQKKQPANLPYRDAGVSECMSITPKG